jgi:hypothetical protein
MNMNKSNSLASMILVPGMNPQALAVLALIQGMTPEFVEYDKGYEYYESTSYWSNGREQGFCLRAAGKQFADEAIHIVVVEHRNSDSIMVYSWVERPGMNPPTLANFTDEIYKNNCSGCFGYGNIMDAAKDVYNAVEQFVTNQMAEKAEA